MEKHYCMMPGLPRKDDPGIFDLCDKPAIYNTGYNIGGGDILYLCADHYDWFKQGNKLGGKSLKELEEENN